MKFEYYLPKIKELHIRDYDLYKCPLDINFSSKLNLVFGTNGLGKTTFLNILQYSIIGPYTGRIQSRNWKEQQKLKRPMLGKDYFKNRMAEYKEEATVTVVYSLGADVYEVCHSLYEYRLKSVKVNGHELNGEEINYETYEKKYFGQTGECLSGYLIDKYHRSIERSSSFPDINSYILMITEMMFFTEGREFVFWKQDMCKSILSKFMPREKYFEYDEVQKLIKKYDSQARLTSYKMSMVKDFLGADFFEKGKSDSEYSLSDLEKANRFVDSCKARIGKIEKSISANVDKIRQNRTRNEEIIRKINNIESKWYDNIFPDEYQEMYNRYVPSILDGRCPFCGREHLDVKLEVEKCFFCLRKIEIRQRIDLTSLEIEQKNLENERKRIQNNYSLLRREGDALKSELYNEEKELHTLIEEQQKVKQMLDINNSDSAAKYQKLELEKQNYLQLLETAKGAEQLLAREIDECIFDVFKQYSEIFKKYAHSFLGAEKSIELELVGNAKDAFFKFYLEGKERESEFALSESQRIFVDMAYRLATLEFFHRDAYFISETPDSTLDFMFEENAITTFSYFIEAGNTVIMSANARSSNLIKSLMKKYKDECTVVNLIKISNLANERLSEVLKLTAYDFLED